MSGANLSRLKAAYHEWHTSRGASSQVWLDLFDDHLDFQSCGTPDNAAIAFATNRRRRHEVVDYFTGLNAQWSMVHFTPHTFVVEGDAIAMFGRCSYTSKATGKAFDVAISHLWKFRDGKVIAVNEVFDSARALAAAAP